MTQMSKLKRVNGVSAYGVTAIFESIREDSDRTHPNTPEGVLRVDRRRAWDSFGNKKEMK